MIILRRIISVWLEYLKPFMHKKMNKHIQHNKDERTQFFRKLYLSLYLKEFERVTKGIIVLEVSWRLNKTATYWPPLFWLLQPFFHTLLDCSTEGLGAQPLWDMVLIPASSLQLILTSCLPGYIIIWRPPTSCERHNFALDSTPWQSRSLLISWYLQPDAPVIYTGAFLLLTAWPGSICNSLKIKLTTSYSLPRRIYIYIYIYGIWH